MPDYIYGVRVTDACDIHDWCYERRMDKEMADLVFWNNLESICRAKSSRDMLWMRLQCCHTYYMFVRDMGGG